MQPGAAAWSFSRSMKLKQKQKQHLWIRSVKQKQKHETEAWNFSRSMKLKQKQTQKQFLGPDYLSGVLAAYCLLRGHVRGCGAEPCCVLCAVHIRCQITLLSAQCSVLNAKPKCGEELWCLDMCYVMCMNRIAYVNASTQHSTISRCYCDRCM